MVTNVEVLNDMDLAKNVQTERCEDSLNMLIGRHSALCYTMYKRFAPALSASGIPLEEIAEDKDSIIYKSALSFNPEKNVKFSTWLGNQVKYQCLNAMNRRENFTLLDDKQLTYVVDRNHLTNQPEDYSNTIDYVFEILDQLKDKRIKEIFKLRYFGEGSKRMPWAKVAEGIGISTQTAINLHETGRKILAEKLTSQNVFDFV
jgi:RNA polymerase sigma factor (sigma-70 family)